PYLDQLRDLPPTRDGTLRHLELLNLGGIVTFPSFHAASALLYAWALWPLRWARPLLVFINGMMLAATPLNGGHYFVDVIAGITVALVSIVAAHRLAAHIASRPIKPIDIGVTLPQPVAPQAAAPQPSVPMVAIVPAE